MSLRISTELRRHLLPAGGGHRHRAGRVGGHPVGTGSGARKEFGLRAHLGLTVASGAAGGGRGRRLGRGGHVGRSAAGRGHQPGAGVRRQPAELPLEHGPVLPWGRLALLCAQCSWPAPQRAASALARGRRAPCCRSRLLVKPVRRGSCRSRWPRWPGRRGPQTTRDGPPRPELRFPRDHGAHLGTRTDGGTPPAGWASDARRPSHGVQVTFFRAPHRLRRRQLQPTSQPGNCCSRTPP